jgi:hypothetical protein
MGTRSQPCESSRWSASAATFTHGSRVRPHDIEGWLARSTHRDPINDVGVIVVFERSAHADWGEDGVAALAKGADVEVDAIVAL